MGDNKSENYHARYQRRRRRALKNMGLKEIRVQAHPDDVRAVRDFARGLLDRRLEGESNA